MTILSDLITAVSADLRDTSNATWSSGEVTDLINRGIDAVSDVYPREIVSSIGTIAAATYTYSAGSLTHVYRLEVFTSAGSYVGTIPAGNGSADSGWELHAGVIQLPINYSLTTGYTLKGYGYGRYTQLAAASSVTDLDTAAIWAVRTHCEMKAVQRLATDRSKFQQWQSNSNATDVTQTALLQTWQTARAEWRDEKLRLKRHRKLGD